MNPKDYTGTEWKELAKQFTTKQMRGSLKRAYRAEAKKARQIALSKLHAEDIDVQGNRADWDAGVRAHIYSGGGGFMITVKGRSGRKGRGEKSMHENRFYPKTQRKLPVLMWAEDGTKPRKTKSKTKKYVRLRKGHKTGKMPEYGFLDKAAAEMYRTVEGDLAKEVEKAVRKVAKKSGFV